MSEPHQGISSCFIAKPCALTCKTLFRGLLYFVFFQLASSEVHQLSPDGEHGLCEGQVGDAERHGRELGESTGSFQYARRRKERTRSERSESRPNQEAYVCDTADTRGFLQLTDVISKGDIKGRMEIYVHNKFNRN